MSWALVFTPQAKRDAKKHASSGLKPRVQKLLELVAEDPFVFPPPFEVLGGDLAGLFSRRINIQHRLVYEVHEDKRTIRVVRMWTLPRGEPPVSAASVG